MTQSIRGHYMEAAARTMGRRLEVLQAKDHYRTWHIETVDPSEVHPLPDELQNYIARSGASLSGAQGYDHLVREGRLTEPLMLQELPDGTKWVNASTHDLGGSNSLALLMAMRRAGTRSHPAFIYQEKIEKAKKRQWGEGWKLPPGEREAARAKMKEQAAKLKAATLALSEDEMFGLALEGGRYGGGVSTNQARLAARKAIEFNRIHAEQFESDMGDVVDSLVDEEYGDENEFDEAIGASFAAFGSRAQRYATAGGNHAWALGLIAGMVAAGTPGGYWDCTFGTGSCDDCMDLHGQYMTVQEFEETYHQTLCDGGCNCGFVPEIEGQPLDPNDLLGEEPEDEDEDEE